MPESEPDPYAYRDLSPEPAVPTERDPLPEAEPYRLTGPAERQRFSPLLTALLGGIAAFVVFQGVAMIAMGVFLLEEIAGMADSEGIAGVLGRNPEVVFGANALGQVVGLGMFAVLLARLHSPDVLAYLRIRRPDTIHIVLASVGFYAILPFVSWVGTMARQIPLPEAVREWDTQQQALLEHILMGQINVPLALLFVALTPAICEELLFRGFIQRNVERRLSAAWGIFVVGLAFGAFHLRFVELLPLTVLGIYLAYVVWVSGSLWVGVLVHLLNNGTAILVSDYAQRRPEPVEVAAVAVPWYLAFIGLGISLVFLHAMWRRRQAQLVVP